MPFFRLQSTWWETAKTILRNPKFGFLLLFGFASALPLSLTGSGATFQGWLTDEGVDLSAIAWLSWGAFPYAIKFLWAPLVDKFRFPFLSRRLGWMLVMQIALAIGIIAMGFIVPEQQLPLVAVIAFSVAFLSATQDIAADAYRTDLLNASERGMGASVFVFGYRIAMLFSGAFAMIMADSFGWRNTFLILGLSFAPIIGSLFFAPIPSNDNLVPVSYQAAVIDPIKALWRKSGIFLMLLLIVFYKLGDALALSLVTNFLLKGVGFSLSEVGFYNKVVGLVALLVGAFVGGILMTKISLYRALIWFGIVQAVTNLALYALALAGKSYVLFVFSIVAEHFGSGLGTTAFFALLMSLCDKEFSATQYALLSALASLGRFMSPVCAYIVSEWGWANFYLFTFFAALPGLFFVVALKKNLIRPEFEPNQAT